MSTALPSVDEIKTMSYTDFVGLVGQWNVPPGSYSTLNQWRVFGDIKPDSSVYEAATTTGFSLREMSLMTGCSGVGVDISEKSIKTAREFKEQYAPQAQIEYFTSDAMTFKTDQKFSHIIIGAALRFFPNPVEDIKTLSGYLQDGGMILSTEFYCPEPIPESLVQEARKIFDITVTQEDYKNVMRPYQGFTLVYESRNIPLMETAEELAYYCKSTIDRFSRGNPEVTTEQLDAMYERLLKIKDMSNRLRSYQRYNVLVHKKDSRFYPSRYTELF